MADPYKWRGPKTLRRGKATWDFQAERIVVAFSYDGPMSECVGQRPLIGSEIPDFIGYGLRVTSAIAEEGDGDSGKLHIMETPNAGDFTGSTSPIGEPIFEIEFGELNKAIETHSKCGVLHPDRPKWKDGKKQADASPSTEGEIHTWDDWADLDTDDYIEGGGSNWDLETYKALKEAGVDSYNVGAPVVRRTTYHLSRPNGVGASCYTRQMPPVGIFGGSLGAWDWLAGPDRLTKTGRRYTRCTEWIGAEVWSTDIYHS